MKFHYYFFMLAVSSVSNIVAAEEMNTAAETMPAEMTSETTPAEAEPMQAETSEAATSTVTGDEQAGMARGSVVRSIFTSGIDQREPVDKFNDMNSEQGRVYYFTELRDMSGQTAIHRWEFDGKVMAEVEFNVQGPRWRVWSSKSFVPGWAGEWKVSVLNGAGEVISEDILTYTKADVSAATSASDSSESMPAMDTMPEGATETMPAAETAAP